MAIELRGQPGTMLCGIRGTPAFEGDGFGLGYPESIGDTAASIWFGGLEPVWSDGPGGVQICRGERPGELRYELTVSAGADYVDAHYRLTNLSDRDWAHAHAFNCCQIASSNAIRDHDGLRTYVGYQGRPTPLRQVPRVWSPRATIQLNSVAGQPAGADIPFVAGFGTTPIDVELEGWMAVVARDGRRLVATASRPCHYLFHNLEYACIHAACGFGPIARGQTAEALNRTYFVEATIDEFYRRIRAEMG